MKEAFNNTSILNTFNAKIDDLDIGSEDLIQLEMYWDVNRFSVSGNLMIKDNSDILNLLKPNNNTVITIYAEDNDNTIFMKKFRAIQMNAIKEKSKFTTINIKLLDELSFSMRNTFISKGYNNVSIVDVFDDFLKNHLGDVLYKDTVKSTQGIIKDNIVVPQDRSFFDFFKDYMNRDGFKMFQFRNDIFIVKNSGTYPDSLETSTEVFSELYYQTDHPFKIHEHSLKLNNTLNLLEHAPKEKTIKFNISKTPVITDNTIKDIDINRSEIDYIKTNGIKLNYNSIKSFEQSESEFNSHLMHNSELELVVTGNLNDNKLNTNYEVVFNGNVFHKQGQNEGDIRTSGLYTATKITDKIVSGKIVQKIELVRADFNER